MRVAVIGTGQLGEAILKECHRRSCMGRLPYVKHAREFEATSDRYKGISHKDLDVSSPDAAEKLFELLEPFKPQVVINTAAMHITQECEWQPNLAMSVNAEGSRNVALACIKLRAFYIYISTDYVFSGHSGPGKFDINDRPQPTNIYGMSKLAGEHLALKTHANSAVVRVSHLFGGHGSVQKKGNFVLNLLKKIKAGEVSELYQNIFFSPTYCKDAAKMILSVGDPGIYHACNLGETTPFKFGLEIVKQAKKPFSAIRATTFEPDTRSFSHPVITSMTPSFASARKWEVALGEYLPEAELITASS